MESNIVAFEIIKLFTFVALEYYAFGTFLRLHNSLEEAGLWTGKN